MKEKTALSDAIQNLYRIFGHYPLRTHVNGCPCSVSEADKRALASKPLRLLSQSELGDYSFPAHTTWVERDDYRHFLPRIFELMVSHEGLGFNEEILLGKLAVADWKHWPDEEQSAVCDFLRATWTVLLFDPVPNVQPNAWLCGLGTAGEDLRPYLEEWLQARAASAYEHLVCFIELNLPNFIKRHRLTNSFWSGAPVAALQVCDWLTNLRTLEELEKIYFENENADFSAALALVIEQLEFISKI